MTYLWYVALGVGMGTKENRDHLSDAELASWREHIARASASRDGDAIPGRPGYMLSAENIAGNLLCTVGRKDTSAPLCTFSIVSNSKHAAKLWQALHEGYPHFAVSRGDVPRVPYCAVRAELGLAMDPAAGDWLDQYQVAIAWAWLEKPRT